MRKRTVVTEHLFSAPELEGACGFVERSLEFLKRDKLMPEAVEPGGRGRAALYDMEGLQKLSATGAMFAVTGSLVTSARVADAVVSGMLDHYDYLPFGLNDIVRENIALLSGLDEEIRVDDEIHPYLVFKYLRDHNGSYAPRKARKYDLKLVIVDRQYVFQALPIPSLDSYKHEGMNLQPELEIDWPSRGQEERVEIRTFAAYHSKHGEAAAANLQKKYNAALESPVSVVVLNLSLAIRNTIDAIYESRFDLRRA